MALTTKAPERKKERERAREACVLRKKAKVGKEGKRATAGRRQTHASIRYSAIAWIRPQYPFQYTVSESPPDLHPRPRFAPILLPVHAVLLSYSMTQVHRYFSFKPPSHRFILTLVRPVSIRHHMSTLKHSIRHQQAQLQNLENLLQRAPRISMSFNISNSPPTSPLSDPPLSDLPPTVSNGKVRLRSSFDVLQSLAGPDSNLPLPRHDPGSLSQDGIREGVPMDFGAGPSNQSYKRQSSPTRTLSRMC